MQKNFAFTARGTGPDTRAHVQRGSRSCCRCPLFLFPASFFTLSLLLCYSIHASSFRMSHPHHLSSCLVNNKTMCCTVQNAPSSNSNLVLSATCTCIASSLPASLAANNTCLVYTAGFPLLLILSSLPFSYPFFILPLYFYSLSPLM